MTEVLIQQVPFDLHVLSTPPAFILSQDQTLNKLYLNGLSRSNQVIEVSFLNFKDNELTSSLSLLLPVSLKDSIKSFWCFVCSHRCLIYKVQAARSRRSFIIASSLHFVKPFLFQVQAFIRRFACRANSFILAHPQAFVNTFFQTFFGSRRFSFEARHSHLASALLIYQMKPRLSTLFRNFFWLFFKVFEAAQYVVFCSKFNHNFPLTPR